MPLRITRTVAPQTVAGQNAAGVAETMRRRKVKEEHKGWPYRCPHCGKTVLRESTKAWIESFCTRKVKVVRLQRVNS